MAYTEGIETFPLKLSSFTVFTLIAVVSFLLWLQFCNTYWKSTALRRLNKLPGPTILPVLGNVYVMFHKETDIPAKLSSLFIKYGPTYRLWLGTEPYVFTKDVSLIEKILPFTINANKTEGYKATHFLIGSNSLVTAPTSKWKQDRKVLVHGINSSVHFPRFLASFNKNAKILGDVLEGQFFRNGMKEADIYTEIARCTVQIIFETAIGYHIDLQHEPENRKTVVEAALVCSDIVRMKKSMPWINIPIIWHCFGYSKLQKENMELIRQLFQEVHTSLSQESTSDNEPNYMSLVYKLIREVYPHLDPLSQTEEVFSQFATIVGAGFETISTVFKSVLFLLANNTQCQTRMREEIKSVWTDCSRDLNLNDLGNLQYTELVIKESMRVLPPTPIQGRRLGADLNCGNGVIIPEGTDVTFLVRDIHYDPSIWENPETFCPERFLPQNSVGRSSCAYLPFSVGPRACLGQKFAMMELKVLLSHIVSRFSIHSSKSVDDINHHIAYGIVPHYGEGLPVLLKPL